MNERFNINGGYLGECVCAIDLGRWETKTYFILTVLDVTSYIHGNETPVTGVLQWLMGSRDIQWMSFLTRNTFQNATTYAEAKAMLSNTPMLAPAYFILGGTKHGEVYITFDVQSSPVLSHICQMHCRNYI